MVVRATAEEPRLLHATLWKAGICTAILAAIDLASKAAAERFLPSPRVLTNNELSLGLAGGAPSLLVLLMAMGLALAGALCWRAICSRQLPWWSVAPVLGGALGNLVDRLVHGSVRDFIPMGPVTINLADIAVLAGLVVMTAAWRRPPQPGTPLVEGRVRARGGGDVHV